MDNKNNLPVNPDEEKKKTSKPRKKKALSRRTVSAIYMGVALCMVAMLTVSMVSTTDKIQDVTDDLELPDISLPDVSINIPRPDISQGNGVLNGDDDERPVGNTVSGVTDDITKPEEDGESETESTVQTPVAVYVRPVSGAVTKGYAMETLVFSETMQDFRTHCGVDIAAESGTSVKAYTDGTVTKVENDPFMGMTVTISHDKGVSSVYRNLNTELPKGIEEGKKVKAGEVIGTVGESALIEIAEPTHLHFELWMNGDCVNAEKEIEYME